MPRIPGPEQIPEVAVRNTRRVTQIAPDQTGRALMGLADAAREVSDRIVENQTRTRLAEADLDARRQLMEIERGFEGDDDWETLPQRGAEAARKVFDERGRGLRGVAARAWQVRAQERMLEFEGRLADLSRRRGTDVATRDILRLEEKARLLATDPNARPEDRQIATQTFLDRLSGAEETGLIDATAAERVRLEHTGQVRRAVNEMETLRLAGRIDEVTGALAAAPERWEALTSALTQEIEGNAALEPDARVRLLQAVRQGAAETAVAAMVDRDPGGTLRALRAKDASGPVAELDGAARGRLINAAEAEIERRRVRYEANLERRFRADLTAMEAGILPPNLLNEGEIERVMGPGARLQYRAGRGALQHAPQMARLPTGELNRVAAMQAPRPEDSLDTYVDVTALRQAAARELALRQDPMALIIGRRLYEGDAMGEALATGDLGQINTFLQSRAVHAQVHGRNMGMQPQPLTNGEAEVVRGLLNNPNLAPADRAKMLATLSSGLPRPVQQAMVAQLAGDDVALRYAGTFATQQRPVAGRAPAVASEIMMTGSALINGRDERAGRFKLPSETDLRASWTRYVGDAFRGAGEAEARAYEAYKAAYAGLASEAGRFDGTISTDLAAQAARMAAGEVARFDGRKTLLPPGYDEDTVDQALRSGLPALRQRYPGLARMSANEIRNRLELIGPDNQGGTVYAVRGMLTPEGERVEIVLGAR